MNHYTIADVHSFYDPMMKALDEAGYFKDTGEKRLVLCGDALDRGDDTQKVADFLREVQQQDELIYITGNHEELFVKAMQEVARGGAYNIACGHSHHYTNGTWHSMVQLSGMSVENAVNYPLEFVRRITETPFYRQLLPDCVDYYETANYIWCHGWLPVAFGDENGRGVYRYEPRWREASVEAWQRARWLNGMEMSCKYHINEPKKTVICGHWHASYGHAHFGNGRSEFDENADFSPFYANGIIALDACTAFTGKVNCVVINDAPVE